MATISISQLDSAVSLALGDLFEIAEPDAQSQTGYASKKISLSQEATFIQENVESQNLNTTSKTLVGAINEVDSEGVKWSENNVLGAKNLLKYPYYYNSQVINGITWTVNSDGTITATGTASANSQFILHTREFGESNDFILPNGTYILSDGGLENTNTEIQIGITKNGSYTHIGTTGNGELSFTASGDDYSQNSINPLIQCLVRSGQQNVNVTFKPMIRLASIADNTFEPYAQTNVELTAEKMAWNNYTEYGVKNLIPYPWYHLNGRVNRGITFTFDGEGYISLDGTASTTQAPFFSYSSSTAMIPLILESGKEYILSVERSDSRIYSAIFFFNSDGSGLSCNLKAEFEDGSTRIDANATSLSLYYDNIAHSKAIFTVTSNTTIYIQADLRVPANSGYFDPQDAKGRVMLRDANITDDTWKKFGGSNVQLSSLITDFMSIFASIEITNNARIPYSVGDYMFWKGGFYKVTAAINSGGAITVGTNVTQTTIGAELKAALNA